MDSIQPPDPLCTDLAHAEAALRRLWPSAGGEPHCAADLLVVTQAQHLDSVRAVLDEISAAQTGRQVILVLGQPDLPVQVALVGIRRGSPVERRHCVERIEVPTHAEGLGHLAARLLRPATLKHVWWACCEPPSPAVLRALAQFCDQVIMDTRRLPAFAEVPCLLTDLAWPRTARWRELTAQLFGDPLAARHLRELEHVGVRYVGDDARPAQLFTAWLADALGWPDLRRTELISAARERGALTRVDPGGPDAQFQLHTCGALMHGGVHQGGHCPVIDVRLPPLTLAQGLSELLRCPVRDEGFVRASALLCGPQAEPVPRRPQFRPGSPGQVKGVCI